jgi:hypothetical protein
MVGLSGSVIGGKFVVDVVMGYGVLSCVRSRMAMVMARGLFVLALQGLKECRLGKGCVVF